MSTANSLVPADQLGGSKYGDMATFSEVAKAGSYLPYIALFGGNSDAVKKGLVPMAHYAIALGNNEFHDLGREVDVIPLSWRPKAMVFDTETPVSYYNPKSEDFLRIQKDSEKPDSNCIFGPEFLVWVPSVNKYATFLMGSKTARRQAPELRALIGKGATLKSKLIETPKYTWHGPVITICLTKLEVPPMEDIQARLNDFNNPSESSIEFNPEELEEKREDSTERVR